MKKSFLNLVVIGCALTSMLFFSTCKKDEKDKLTLTCQGDCNSFSYKIGNETGPVTMNLNTSYTYDGYGSLATATLSGTVTYQNSGKSYQVKGFVNYATCKYTVTINNEATCGN